MLIRFIPGTSASAEHYQGFLLEGLARWNQSRAMAIAQQRDGQLRTFNLQLACKVNQLSEAIIDSRLLPYHHAPTEHNEAEVFGVKYLYKQAGQGFIYGQDSAPMHESVDEMDEGFIDESMGDL